MNFLNAIAGSLSESGSRVVVQEIREGRFVAARGSDLLAEIEKARLFLRQAGIARGDRCAILAANSIHWVALDLAIMAEGAIAVPLYPRQAPSELVTMLQDCTPAVLFCRDTALRDSVLNLWPEACQAVLLDEVFSSKESVTTAPAPFPALEDQHPVAIIYTSGTSGEPKGVVLSIGSVNHILRCTAQQLDVLMDGHQEPERVFHYAPFCYAASWVLLLSCLARNSTLSLATDFSRLAEDMRLVSPHYFSNVPLMLERMRARVEEQVRQSGGLVRRLFYGAQQQWLASWNGGPKRGWLSLAIAQKFLFPKIRKAVGPSLKALICGSAPLSSDTQLFFMMLGIPVLQVYGLTETTAICTMDHPERVQPGRVGRAIPGVEMRLGENSEILVRGPNLFLGYWNRPQATEDAMRVGWFLTGDQGEVDVEGNWRITGRVKNVLVLASGHNVAPEPIEDLLRQALPQAKQIILVGRGRSFLAAIITGDLLREQVQAALDRINRPLPHYKRIHGFHLVREPFSVENGLLTTMGKLRRDAIAKAYREPIEALYQEKVHERV